MAAALADRQTGKLANRGKIIGLDELHRQQLWVEGIVFLAHRQVAVGEIQIAHFTGAARRGAEADTAGIGKQVEYAFTGAVLLDPTAGVAQIEKQQWVLPGVTATNTVVQPPLMADLISQGHFAGLVYRVTPINAAIALGSVVVDQQQLKAQLRFDQCVQFNQGAGFKGLVEALHQ
ncbi:hypothetical protein D3C72_1904390 [compost metagenome]